MLDINEILEKFKKNRFVLKALQNPRSPSSVLNYMCSGDTNDPLVKKSLNNINIVSSPSCYLVSKWSILRQVM